MTAYRYAVYAVPVPGHPLAALAADWLGRDARGGAVAREADAFDDLRAEARRYGFHGTLKAPFRLAEGTTEAALAAAAETLAGPALPVRLVLADDLGFPALRPAEPVPALEALAETCVRVLDGFRAPPTPEELARRKPERLSPGQRDLLMRWGYPYVLEEFRFHMTLGARAEDTTRHAGFMRAAAERFGRVLADPVPLGVALFVEPARGAPFTLWRDMPVP
jgi:hypothetical protein